MYKVGIICDLNYSRHFLFKSYFYSVKNLYGTPMLVKSTKDLQGIELLFIADDHYEVNKLIWQQEGFIEYCNTNDIEVVVLTNEKILNSYFPWNIDNLIRLNEIKNLYHYTIDVDDCILLGLKLNRCPMSRTVRDQIVVDINNKKDKIVFIGTTKCGKDSYQNRVLCLEKLQKMIDIDIVDPSDVRWNNYFQTIAGYRFVLSPISNGNFFPMRFYEALSVKSIPIHQVKKNTLSYYNIESKFDDCIFFEEPEEVKDKLESFTLKTSHNKLYMEDTLGMMLKKDGLL